MSPKSYAQMIAPTQLPNGQSQPIGFGLATGTVAKHRTIFFQGGINGFRSVLAYYPEGDIVVAVLANCDTCDIERVGQQVAEVVFATPAS